MEKELVKKYAKGEFTVEWRPGLCIHAGECVKRLPQVYDPEAKPWINVAGASVDELKSQIDKCPSGALSYAIKNEVKSAEAKPIRVEVMQNGPLLVHGLLTVVNPDDRTENKSKTTAFCRCGHSKNKPYCDGGHKESGFQG